jgi:hypothetical protein
MPARKLLSLICLLLSTTAQADDQLVLAQQYQPGKSYLLSVESVIETRHAETDATAYSTAEIKQTYTLRTSSDTTGQTLVDVQVSSLQATIASPDQLLKYDSANPALSPPALQQTFGALKDKSFTLVYDANHRFVETRDAASDDQTPLGSQTGMSSQQWSEAFRRLRDAPLPPHPVSPGDAWNWENQVHLPPLGDILLKGRSTMEPHHPLEDKNLARLKITGELKFSPLTSGDSSPVTISQASSTGTLLFDRTLAQVKSQETVTSLTIQQNEQTFHLRQTEKVELVSVTDTPNE